MSGERVVIVGGGIIGLATARQLCQLRPDLRVVVLEKERAIASHQSGRNSGVVHAGLYYRPGSLKARLCRRGGELLRELSRTRDIPYVECGKVVVARDDTELAALAEIEARARANAVPGLRRLSADELRAIEPHVRARAALHSPRTAITDFAAVARALAADVIAHGGEIRLAHEVRSLRRGRRGVEVVSGHGALVADRVVVCAGLHADRVARLAGDTEDPAIVPFRGEYLRLLPPAASLVRGLVYPVPNLAYPFLGVHFTRRLDGSVDIGPNAVLALAREGYRWRDVSLGDVAELLSFPGFRRLVRRYWRVGLRELVGSLSKRAFVREARSYVPELSAADAVRAPAGVRAQAVGPDGSLVDDFVIHETGPVVSVRNAPSPAATSSLAIAELLAQRVVAGGA
ncbi:MAG TPA: L-2-hydroxyglutarate oxidase [Acidimicrobiales bacterium]|jgi:L-2-hydroxyglutarate oxidase LhgO|nr:L-2-hydroxyglutarate oxidase [Acidimicrobiales bacterium]